jgi:hypothetical protein
MNKQKDHLNDRVMVYAAIWAGSYILSISAFKLLDLPVEVGWVLTFITVLAFSVFMYKYYRSIFFMDEVQVRVQMEAIVIAFSLSLLLVMTLGLLDLFWVLNQEDWSYRHLFPIFIAFYFFGLFFSGRKYNLNNEKHD